jgi:threonine aldolase
LYFLSTRGDRTPADKLRELAEYCERRGLRRDIYGQGEDLQAFERQVAELLGFEAAVFMPSGTMAQQIALRIWADEARCPRVGFHATSHLEANEEHAYRQLHGLTAELLGDPERPLVAADLRRSAEPLAAVLIELPMRRLGGVLPAWDELKQLQHDARNRGARVHLDGARLWESGPYYARPYREICAGFDSAYVSFYKGLGGLTGAMLLGPAPRVAQARVWLRRHGGNLYQLTPYWASAQMALETRLAEFGARWERAKQLARALAPVRGLRLRVAEPPHTPFLHLWLEGTPEKLAQGRDRVAREDRLWMGGRFFAGDRPGWSLLELAVEDGTMQLADAEIVAAFGKLLEG